MSQNSMFSHNFEIKQDNQRQHSAMAKNSFNNGPITKKLGKTNSKDSAQVGQRSRYCTG